MLGRLKLCVGGVVACFGLLLFSGLAASPAQARVVQLPNGRTVSILVPRGRPLPSGARVPSLSTPAATTCDTSTNELVYQCGGVVHSSQPYLIFWDPSGTGISSGSESLIERYLTDTATPGTSQSDVYGVVHQYFDSSGYAGQSQTFSASSQAVVDTQAYPTRAGSCHLSTGYTACLTDAQVQAEITRLITANGWPTGGTSTNAPVYFVVLPQHTDECISGSTCVDNAFCAYHDVYGTSDTLYAVLPFGVFNFGPKGCQTDGTTPYQSPNNDQADNVLDNLSHEYNEAVTDPIPGGGWVNPGQGTEIGDLCEETGSLSLNTSSPTDPNAYLPTLGGSEGSGTLYDQLINGHQYYTQTEWSNGAVDCRAQPASATLTPTISAPSTGATENAVSFDPTDSNVAAGVSSATWDFGDGTTSFASGALAATSHTYATPGPYTVKLTLVDDQGNVAQTTTSIEIGSAPTAAFAMPASAPVGTPVTFDASSSSDSNAGGSVVSYAWDFGDGTTGTVASPQHTYRSPGAHLVDLTVTDNFGFRSTATTRAILVTTQPLRAGLTADATKVVTGQPVALSAAGSSDPNAGGSIIGYGWQFGDGAAASGVTVGHTYSIPGTYTVTVGLTDSYGLAARRSLIVLVVPRPLITKVSAQVKRHRHYVLVTVSQPGKVKVGRTSSRLAGPGTARLKLALSRRQLRRLSSHHAVRLRLTIVYTPDFGPVVELRKALTLRR